MNTEKPTLQEAIDRLIATTEEIARQIEKIKSAIGSN